MTFKYYAVAAGRQTGIFQDWDTVKALVTGYNGSMFKGFKTITEAQNFLRTHLVSTDAVSSMSTALGSVNISSTSATSATPVAYTTTSTVPQSSSASPQAVASAAAPPSPIHQVKKVIAYTDGSFRDNSSGYGVILIYPTTQVFHGYGHVPLSVGNTNNVAELYAIYVAVSAIPDGDMDIYTDSQYSIDVITGIKRAHVNVALIEAILQKMAGRKINLYHVYGHSGVHFNEMVDDLAKAGTTLPNDDPVWFQPFHEPSGGGIPT